MTDGAATAADMDLPGFEAPQAQAPAAPAAGPLIDMTGTLVSDAELRSHPVAHTKGVGFPPVLCFDLRPDSGQCTRLHCEQPFPESARRQAQALAAVLKKGTRVQLRTSLAEMRVSLPHVHSVQVAQPHPTTS